MELCFSITAEQCRRWTDPMTAARIARHEARRAAIQARIEQLVRGLALSALLVLPPALAGLATLDGSSRQRLVETTLGFAAAVVVYGLLWRRYGAALARFAFRLGQQLGAQMTRAATPAITRMVTRSVRRSVARLEGQHRWSLSPSALSMQGPSGKTAVIPWKDVVYLRDIGEFYQLATRASARFGLGYYLAKQSTEMDDGAYAEGLNRLLECVPAAARL